jgi:uncharacterized protein YndB with AHSA1/START domain
MSDAAQTNPVSDRELVLTRLIDAPRDAVYRAWTEPELLKQWFAPKPFTTPVAELDVRPGGSNLIVMAGPDGVEMPNPGVYLEVVPNEKLVFTNAYARAWEPSEKPFMTVVLTFQDEGGKTRYTARVLHWRSRAASKTRVQSAPAAERPRWRRVACRERHTATKTFTTFRRWICGD